MKERLAIARSGARTAYFGSLALHSSYNPEIEAERYIDSLKLSSSIKIFLLIEPCLAYLVKSLRVKFPHSRIVSLQSSSFFTKEVLAAQSDAVWELDSHIELDCFLESIFTDKEASEVQIIEWLPAYQAYPKSKEIKKGCKEFLQRAIANELTLRAFGKRWIRNTFRLLDSLKNPSTITSGDTPVIVAASGPSLEGAFSAILQAQSTIPCLLLAVSSAVPALLSAGIKPDLVVASDGGGWARYHLFESDRNKLPLAIALGAAIPSSSVTQPALLISDGKAWQRLILDVLSLSALIAPQRGTVSATALDLALAITDNRVYAAGFDFSQADIATHARPYALDRFREDGASRLRPEYSYAFNRCRSIETSSAFDVYAAWFAGRRDYFEKRVQALHTIHPSFPVSNICVSIPAGGQNLPKLSISKRYSFNVQEQPSKTAFLALKDSLTTERDRGNISTELSDLLGLANSPTVVLKELELLYQTYAERLE